MKLLCTGDLHLRRVSSRIPEGSSSIHSAERAWERIVDLAVRRSADALILAGDIVDENQSAAFFEAIGPLERGLRKLKQAGIKTFAIAGNHDFAVLPRLVSGKSDEFDLHLLGPGGEWENFLFPDSDTPALCITGRSFTARHDTNNPLSNFEPPDGNGFPVVGILHATVTDSSCPYAPVPLADLQRAREVSLWLVGHMHAAQDYGTVNPRVINLGSPQAFDPGEPGIHGPWLIEFKGHDILLVEQIPLSTVHYCEVDVDVTGITDEAAFRDRVEAATDGVVSVFPSQSEWGTPVFSCRVNLTGRVNVLSDVIAWSEELKIAQPWAQDGVVIDKFTPCILPDYDLEELSRAPDATGLLAGIILSIEQGSIESSQKDLLEKCCAAVSEVRNSKYFRDLREDQLPQPAVFLRTECLRLLDALMRQKGAPGNG